VAKPALLIVDDDQFIRSMLTSAFGDEYRVICAGNGLEGIKKAVEFKPNVILTDMQMPEADGYELLEQLQQNAETRSIPVVLMTGRNEPDEEVMALDKGFFDFVTKPFGMPRLYARIKKAMRYSGWNVANKKL
jgi:CheY-like chemotaxis protein